MTIPALLLHVARRRAGKVALRVKKQGVYRELTWPRLVEQVSRTGFVSVEAFDFHMLIQYLAMVIIGGLGSALGACLGAAFVIVLPHVISVATEKLPLLQGLGGKAFELQIGVFGLIMLLFSILEPRGLAGIWARVRFYFQLWPFKYRSWES